MNQFLVSFLIRPKLMVGLHSCFEIYLTSIHNKWFYRKSRLLVLNSNMTFFIYLLILR